MVMIITFGFLTVLYVHYRSNRHTTPFWFVLPEPSHVDTNPAINPEPEPVTELDPCILNILGEEQAKGSLVRMCTKILQLDGLTWR